MENFEILIERVINTFDGEYFHMVNIKVTIIHGKFPIRSAKLYVRVIDQTNTVSCFMSDISGNRKQINASFTTDAFEVFPGNVSIEFGYDDKPMGVFENFDINNNILPLDPIVAGIIVPDADNAWLQNHINI